MPRVLLCIPPDYDHNFPPLATPALLAFLKHNGIQASQIDLNLAYRDFLCAKIDAPGLSAVEKKFLVRPVLKAFFLRKLNNRYYSSFLPRLDDRVSTELPYDNNSNSAFYFTERMLDCSYLFRYLEDPVENTFYQFYRDCGILQGLKKDDVKVLGISIISPSQAIAALTLGLLVKRELPDIHVTIGGQWPTLYRRQIRKRKDLFACFDSVVLFEGETPLLRLVQALFSGKNVRFANIMTSDCRINLEHNSQEEVMDKIPCPDFSGLPLESYNGSKRRYISLTYESSRGCYWSKCAYCVDLPLPKPAYRVKDPKLVLNDIRELQKKFKASNLMLGDPGLSPRQMLEVSKRINAAGLKIDWWTMARLDPGFTYKVFAEARKSGLRKINFGFESACDRICGLVNKGNTRKCSERIIRDCRAAGILVDLQTMVGMPGESMQDGLETLDFLIKNRRHIDSVSFNAYYLTPGNHVYNDPRKYGIEYDRKTKLPFRFFTPFKNIRGMNGRQVQSLINTYYALSAKSSKTRTRSSLGKPESGKGCGPANASGKLIFVLNGEAIELRYIRDNKTKEIEIKEI
jgi:radical SAM superfamily enzyme YgiQ (UPF0313 family)